MNRRHHALPRIWLLTDERQGDRLWDALDRLPKNAGVVVRHYSLAEPARQAMARRIARRGVFVAYSGDETAARRAGAHAMYGQATRPCRLPRLASVHDRREIVAAERNGAALLLLSPAFQTRSHPRDRSLGPLRFGLLAREARIPVIALGGMTSTRFKRLRPLGAKGWAAIDGWVDAKAPGAGIRT